MSATKTARFTCRLSTAMRRLTNLDHYGGIVLEIDSLNGMDAAAEQSRSTAAPDASHSAQSARGLPKFKPEEFARHTNGCGEAA